MDETEQGMPVPREYVHLTTLYDLLSEQAKDGVFTGSITRVAKSMNVSHQYHSRLPRLLVQLGCIDWKVKGAGARPGEIVLLARPTLSQYNSTYKRKHLTRSATIDNIKAAIETTNRRLPSIDLPRWIESVEMKLVDFEARLAALETPTELTEGGTDLAS